MGKNPKNFWAPSPDSTPGSEGGHPSETTTITGYSTKSKQKKIFRANERFDTGVPILLFVANEPWRTHMGFQLVPISTTLNELERP